MTPRSIRRAAERRAEKEARKALRLAPVTESDTSEEAQTPSAEPLSPSRQLLNDMLDWESVALPSRSRWAANSRNAQLSTGPRTEAGKCISSLNAVKTGLTGRTVLLPTDDADAYREHLAAYQAEYAPQGHRESELVQSLADTQWRLARIPALESAVYARGRYESAEMYADHPKAERIALIELESHLRYEKQLRNLQLQESRLHRRYTQDLAELRRLQAERKATAESAKAAPKPPVKLAPEPADPKPIGFVFSTKADHFSAAPFAPETDIEKAA